MSQASIPYGLLALPGLGLNSNAQDRYSNTLLHLAAKRPDFFLLRGLLRHDPSITNNLGKTAVDVIRKRAAENPHRYPADRFEQLPASRDSGG